MIKTAKPVAFTEKDDIFSFNLDTVLLCLGLFAVGISLNGKAALYQGIICLVSGIVSEYIGFSLIIKRKGFSDMSVFASSMLIALLLPASSPLYIGALASAFAVFVAKIPFGGCVNAPFVPAAAGFCFVCLLFPEEVFTYPEIYPESLAFFGDGGFIKGETLIDMLRSGKGIKLNIFGITNLLTGNIPGAVGTTSLLALFGAFIYRLIRNRRALISSLGFILSSAVFVCLFPRLNTDILTCVITELSAGSLLFIAVMLINDPVTCPAKPMRALIYGLLAGVLSMALRYFCAIYDPGVFAVLIMNCLWPALTGETPSKKLLPKQKNKKKKHNKKSKKVKKSTKKTEYTPAYDLFSEDTDKGGADVEQI